MHADSQKDHALLSIHHLTVGFERTDGSGRIAHAVKDVSFTLPRGRTLCLVGESGCGKSVTALSIPRLLPSPPSRFLGGSIYFEGQDLAALPESELMHLRGGRIGMIFQDPMTSLNPVIRVGEQIAEGLRLHKKLDAAAARDAAVGMLEKVGIASAPERAQDYPHQMSGGMRQRVMIAMALACSPSLLIADEPTTALDVTVQRQILSLMRTLIDDMDSSLLLITHDFDVVALAADDVAVMYAGRIVEQGRVQEILHAPQHPYTIGLLGSLPGRSVSMDGAGAVRKSRLGGIAGSVPDLWSRPPGCTFHPRCPHAFERCRTEEPSLSSVQGACTAPAEGHGTLRAYEHLSRCWLHDS